MVTWNALFNMHPVPEENMSPKDIDVLMRTVLTTDVTMDNTLVVPFTYVGYEALRQYRLSTHPLINQDYYETDVRHVWDELEWVGENGLKTFSTFNIYFLPRLLNQALRRLNINKVWVDYVFEPNGSRIRGITIRANRWASLIGFFTIKTPPDLSLQVRTICSDPPCQSEVCSGTTAYPFRTGRESV